MFLNGDVEDPVGRMDHALNVLMLATPALDKLESAVKKGVIKANGNWSKQLDAAMSAEIINQDEKDLLEDYERARIEAIAVDEFTNEQIEGKIQ